jgi:Holliday junction resolvasome RuvABC endonuclease subunit
MITIGIDPDLHATAIAIVIDRRLTHVKVAKVGRSITGSDAVTAMAERLATLAEGNQVYPDLLVVEGQQIYVGKTKDYDSILRVGQVAGAALASLAKFTKQCLLPRPNDWKGTLPKHVCQGRALKHLGIGFEVLGGSTEHGSKNESFCVPSSYFGGPPKVQVVGGTAITVPDWKHISDAVALAVWGAEQLNSAARIEAAAARGR